MSSAETPDDREERPFSLRRWLIQIAALLVFVGAGLAIEVWLAS